jgi:hypothetical protein
MGSSIPFFSLAWPSIFTACLIGLQIVVEVLVSYQCWILDIFVHFWLNCCVKDN